MCRQAAPQGTACTGEAGSSFLPGVCLSGDVCFINLLPSIPSHFLCQIVPCRGLFAFKEIGEIQVSSLWLLSADGFSSCKWVCKWEKEKKKKRASTHSNDPTYHSLAGQQFCLQAEKQPFPHSCTGRNLLVVIPLGVSLDVGSTTCFCTAHWHCWLLKSCEYKEWCCLAKSPANCSQEEDASCFSESGGVPLWMCQSSGLGGRIHWFTKFVSGRSSW